MIPLSLGRHTRRDFLRTSAVAMSGLGLAARPAWAEPPPEVRTLKLSKEPYACMAPQYVVDEFLAAEGFSGQGRAGPAVSSPYGSCPAATPILGTPTGRLAGASR